VGKADWSMPRRADACAGCQRAFEVGETFRAYLYEAPEGYARRDYCLNCQPPDEPEPLGSWKTSRPEPAPRKILPFDRDAIYGFFTRLEDAEERPQIHFRFVLALLLWRKKVLKLERSVTVDDREIWEFVAIRTGDVHRVQRPALDEAELQQLSDQLEQLLAGQPVQADPVTLEALEEDRDG